MPRQRHADSLDGDARLAGRDEDHEVLARVDDQHAVEAVGPADLQPGSSGMPEVKATSCSGVICAVQERRRRFGREAGIGASATDQPVFSNIDIFRLTRATDMDLLPSTLYIRPVGHFAPTVKRSGSPEH
jgi:hypothetical protein